MVMYFETASLPIGSKVKWLRYISGTVVACYRGQITVEWCKGCQTVFKVEGGYIHGLREAN
jgi:hypothetical protein